MKKQLGITVSCLLLMAGLALADSITILDSTNSNGSTKSYSPGASFTLTMGVNPTNPPETNVVGFSLWLAPGNAAWNNFFSITGHTAGTTFPDPNIFSVTNDAIVAGGNANDLGFTLADVTIPVASPVSYNGGTLTITIGNSVAPGQYTIHTATQTDNNAKGTEITDGSFAGHFVTSSIYTINVSAVPEPATLSLLGLGGLGSFGLTLLRARRRG